MVVINPAAGQGSLDLRLLNHSFHEAGYEWDIEVTNQYGDGARLAREAARSGASIVAAYGGDGTVMDVASGLVGSRIPLAILPGGTGNALARDLGIPFDLPSAITVMVDTESQVRQIDIGRVNGRYFLLRLGAGLEAEITRTADRDLKDRIGLLAYFTATIQAWGQTPVSHYQLLIDGESIEMDGLACIVANAGSLGLPGLTISQSVRIDDGVLDVIVIRRADLAELASIAASVLGTNAITSQSLPHWQCREIYVSADPPQAIHADGEELGNTPLKASVLPKALHVIVPKQAEEKK